ncbi:MAG: hypothetical protein Ct9H300mP1_23780 [Planctomycetaceae bacterium]|nr:MAG: hypothetical protein Ct9H300mP1_23780 [Planctomycetaceae bacterium]
MDRHREDPPQDTPTREDEARLGAGRRSGRRVLLTLGAYTFSEMMMVEAEATGMYARQVQTRAMADSGVELVAACWEIPWIP